MVILAMLCEFLVRHVDKLPFTPPRNNEIESLAVAFDPSLNQRQARTQNRLAQDPSHRKLKLDYINQYPQNSPIISAGLNMPSGQHISLLEYRGLMNLA